LREDFFVNGLAAGHFASRSDRALHGARLMTPIVKIASRNILVLRSSFQTDRCGFSVRIEPLQPGEFLDDKQGLCDGRLVHFHDTGAALELIGS
jgi:hypothetical protein